MPQYNNDHGKYSTNSSRNLHLVFLHRSKLQSGLKGPKNKCKCELQHQYESTTGTSCVSVDGILQLVDAKVLVPVEQQVQRHYDEQISTPFDCRVLQNKDQRYAGLVLAESILQRHSVQIS